MTLTHAQRIAWLEAPQIVVRCAPTFASVLSGAGATHDVDLPPIGRGLLVVVGSHVPSPLGRLVLRQFLQAPPDRARCNPGGHRDRRDPPP